MRYYRTGEWRRPMAGEWYEAVGDPMPIKASEDHSICFWILLAVEDDSQQDYSLDATIQSYETELARRLKAEAERDETKANLVCMTQCRDNLRRRIDAALARVENCGHRGDVAGCYLCEAWRILARNEEAKP